VSLKVVEAVVIVSHRALLMLVVFPWVEPNLPFNQVTTSSR